MLCVGYTQPVDWPNKDEPSKGPPHQIIINTKGSICHMSGSWQAFRAYVQGGPNRLGGELNTPHVNSSAPRVDPLGSRVCIPWGPI